MTVIADIFVVQFFLSNLNVHTYTNKPVYIWFGSV